MINENYGGKMSPRPKVEHSEFDTVLCFSRLPCSPVSELLFLELCLKMVGIASCRNMTDIPTIIKAKRIL